jgi:hypothetical protein
MAARQMTIPYSYADPAELKALAVSISPDRLATYLNATGGDEIAAYRLYAWNMAAAGSFYSPLQALEVTTRNALNDRLIPIYGLRWFENAQLLRQGEIRMVTEAKDKLVKQGKAGDPGRIVAELPFSFWVGLLANAYDTTLWRTALYRAFAPRQNRHDLHDRLDRLRTLRNRIAHHEPIFQRQLVQDYTRLLDVLGCISPAMCSWLECHSRVPLILALEPTDIMYI